MPHTFKPNPFDEQSLLATPNPICSSSMAARSKDADRRATFDYDDIPRRLSEANSSLGILSIKSSISPRTSLSLNSHLEEQRNLAICALDRANSHMGKRPSRILRTSEVPSDSTSSKFINSQSTISESDLFPNSSTPRSSTFELSQVKGRHSISKSVARLSEISKTADMEDLMKNFSNFLNPNTVSLSFGSDMFQSAEKAEEQLYAEEMAWKRDKNLPVEYQDFSVNSVNVRDSSVAAFFRGRSEDCSDLISESFKNVDTPVALIDDTSTPIADQKSTVLREKNDTLSLSNIQRILSDTNQTPNKALELFWPTKKNHSSRVPKQISPLKEVDCEGFVKPQGPPPRAKTSIRKSLSMETSVPRFSESTSRQSIQDMKENIENPKDYEHEKSISSTRSSSSLSNFPDGKLPIETTSSELIWGCIKIGKTMSKDFIIRNKSSNRIRFLIVLKNPMFKVICERGEFDSSSNVKLVLHPHESKTIVVQFSPTKVGAAVCNLQFDTMNSSQVSKQFIRLFGYGGFGNVVINMITKDPTGKFLMSLGSIDNYAVIKKSFTLKNEGVLPVFAYLYFNSVGFYQFSSIKIKPDKVIVMPQEQIEVLVTFSPKKEDFEYIKSRVNFSFADIGTLTLIHGNEVDRGRLRQVCCKATAKNLQVPEAAANLIVQFSQESMPNDLREFKEAAGSINQILKLFNTKQIILYFEHDNDHTVTGNCPDETVMFQTLCHNDSEFLGNTFCTTEGCTVEPSKILLTPPTKENDLIVLSNSGQKKLYFEVCIVPEGLKIKPQDGMISPGEKLSITVIYDKKSCKDKTSFIVKVLIENEVHEVNVKILSLTKG